jgi:uncharacterized lipoprotein YmbA
MTQRFWWLAAALCVLAGCGGGAQQRTYVLSPPVAPAPGLSAAADAGLHLQPVLLPDYLDTTEIMLRSGQHELKASPTGQWGERLSDGMTQALAADLAVLLPREAVTIGPAAGPPARQIVVTVDAFDVQADGRCVLTARWTILKADNATVLAAGQQEFVTEATGQTPGPDDAGVVAAMAKTVQELADSIGAVARAAPQPGLGSLAASP